VKQLGVCEADVKLDITRLCKGVSEGKNGPISFKDVDKETLYCCREIGVSVGFKSSKLREVGYG
jgi:hypothetical protein